MPAPTRSLSLAGASNFRDLGGYSTHDGRTVRWRRLFRADHLAALTPADLAVLSELGVDRSLDFRGELERESTAYRIPGIRNHALAIEPTVVQSIRALLEAGHDLKAADAVRLMQNTYLGFVHDNAHRFAGFFEHVLDEGGPLVFHCTAGKDRTGFAAALLLTALGVPRPVIMQDYLLTNAYYKRPAVSSTEAPMEVLQVLWRVQEEFLDVALDALDADYGGVDGYLAKLGVHEAQRARLATLYLE